MGQIPVLGQDGLGLGSAPTMQAATPGREEAPARAGANPGARPAQPPLSATATPPLPEVSSLDQVQPLPR